MWHNYLTDCFKQRLDFHLHMLICSTQVYSIRQIRKSAKAAHLNAWMSVPRFVHDNFTGEATFVLCLGFEGKMTAFCPLPHPVFGKTWDVRAFVHTTESYVYLNGMNILGVFDRWIWFQRSFLIVHLKASMITFNHCFTVTYA